MQFPSLPPNLSLSAMAQFGMGVLTAPPLLVYLSLYFKPVVEMRIYKLIRRRLPKPTHADETSIKVALDNDLIDWMVPSLGRRSEEEIVRSRLTLFQDIVNEIHAFKWWASWCFGLTKPKKYRKDRRGHFLERDSGMESLRHSVEELQNDLIAVESRARLSQQQSTEPQDTAGVQPPHNHAVRIQPSTPGPASSTRIPDPGAPFDSSRVLSNDENHISQSPDEMSAADLSEMAPLRRAGSVPPIGRPNQEVRRHNNGHSSRRNSRSNTLFSRPTSPESSPPTSPRVRASLIHQSSEIITMQLELLSHRNQHDQNLPTLRPGPHNQILNQDGVPDDPRSVTELLDNIISSRGPNLATPSDAVDSDGLSALTAGATPTRRNNETEPAIPNEQQAPAPGIGPETPRPDSPPVPLENVLPDDLDDPGPEPDLTQTETEQLFDPASLDPIRPPTSTSLHEPYRSGGPHRVTILACHPLDSLASHMSSIITNIMFIPFESLYLRSLATSYLASRASSPGQPLRSDIRPLSLWPGGSASSTLTYIGKLGLVMGIQAAVDASIWGVITGVAIRIGKGLCHWGDL